MPPRPKPPAPEPTLGLQRSRVLASLGMYVIAVAVLYQKYNDSGMLGLIASHARARLPWVSNCGLLPDKEFVLLADRIVRPRSGVGPGAGAVGWGAEGGRQVGKMLA